MTKRVHVLKNLLVPKLQLTSYVVLVYLAAVIVTIGWGTWHHGYQADFAVVIAGFYALIAGIVLFVLLANHQERVWTTSRFRLAPVTDLRLYVMNVLSSFISMLYGLIVGVTVIGLLSVPLQQQAVPLQLQADHAEALWRYGLAGVTMMLSACLYMWIFISMIHLVGVSISAFLPPMRQRIVKFCFYLVVLVLVLMALNGLEGGVRQLAPHLGFNFTSVDQIEDAIPAFYWASFWSLVESAVYSVINVLLLHNWVETKQA
ncbi:hypothetical protein [Lacticaseibacillus thailandensis]|uniref:Uncharacterized protein n=1 Tax=Lacticaseibacillus thailandensis DSM 22698 = JCM 13996 TaxID=1423810 RepID=A0A0R2C4G2_9LACO|nr:hypothetical protein [Lacticaseibacillus thailandensis]KRM86504.1 hypothetical protein FD19_GL001934 [Lacticaseibacillus thailandensis DSM 22698 = JCM 13996]